MYAIIVLWYFFKLCISWPQHAVGYVSGEQYYGAKASINVWAPRVDNQYEFSLSQMWVISGSFGDDLNTIEAGWQACLSFYFSLFFLYFFLIKQKNKTNSIYYIQNLRDILCEFYIFK